jgi:putative spermidine/putrescine transport system permease protein
MARWLLRIATGAVLLFLYVPIAFIVLYAFNGSRGQTWPITEWTTEWFGAALGNPDLHAALILSIQAAIGATIIALVLGTLAALVVYRFRFFGRETISYVVILPIALPGIVTAVALQNTFSRRIDVGPFDFQVGFGFHSLVIAHATFCVVLAYNNVVARLRRMSPNLLEASADLGADGVQTFRHVTFPLVRSALLAGGILAFALSFDEIVVTTFTSGPGIETLPQWILNNLTRPNNVPLVNVVATVTMLLSIPLAWLAQRLSDGATAAM